MNQPGVNQSIDWIVLCSTYCTLLCTLIMLYAMMTIVMTSIFAHVSTTC